VTFVDIGGFTAMINVPELSWRYFDHPSDVVTVGQEILTEVLDVDMMRERVSLSLKALQADPMVPLAHRVGEVVTGTVTKLVPIGVFVRVEDREDGFEGLVPTTELCEDTVDHPETLVRVGDPLLVRILDVDPSRRRIALSHLQALRHEEP